MFSQGGELLAERDQGGVQAHASSKLQSHGSSTGFCVPQAALEGWSRSTAEHCEQGVCICVSQGDTPKRCIQGILSPTVC